MAERKDNRCPHKDCRFHSTRLDSGSFGDCHYMSVTGHSKLGSMTPEQRQQYRKGEIRCPLYEPGPKLRRGNSDLFPRVPEKVPRLYPEKEKVREKTVRYKNVNTEPRRKLYLQGYNDYEIARMLDMSPTAIALWRRYEKLPANAPKGNPAWLKMREEKKKCDR